MLNCRNCLRWIAWATKINSKGEALGTCSDGMRTSESDTCGRHSEMHPMSPKDLKDREERLKQYSLPV